MIVFILNKAYQDTVLPALIVTNMGVSKNTGSPKSSILTGFSIIIDHPFWGTPIFGNTRISRLHLKIFRSQEKSTGWMLTKVVKSDPWEDFFFEMPGGSQVLGGDMW